MTETTVSGGGIPDSIAAMLFDTGGTLFDWHSAVLRALESRGADRGISADWPAVTKTWRTLSTSMVDAGLPQAGGRATMNMDDVLALTLRTPLEQDAVSGFTPDDEADLVLAWRRMQPWPEASRGADLSWDAIISCEMIGAYKTHRTPYETAARWLDLPRERIMLVSTHNNDIAAARAYGFHTAFAYRPREWSDIPSRDPEPGDAAEMVARDLVDLARQCGLGLADHS